MVGPRPHAHRAVRAVKSLFAERNVIGPEPLVIRDTLPQLVSPFASQAAGESIMRTDRLPRRTDTRMKPLFNKVDIFNVLEHQKQGLKEVFQAVTNAELDADPVAVASRLLEEFGINVPVLEEDEGSRQRSAGRCKSRPDEIYPRPLTTVLCRRDGNPGHRPVQGRAGLFAVQPTMFTSNPPFAQKFTEMDCVVVEYRSTNRISMSMLRRTAHLDRSSNTSRVLKGSAEILKGELQQLINSLIQKRKQERGAH